VAADASVAPSASLTALMPLLKAIQLSLETIRDGVNPSHDASLSVATDGNPMIACAEEEASRSLETALEDRIAKDGMRTVVTILREVYESSGLVQRHRLHCAGAEADQADQTSNLMIDTLQRKCNAMEQLLRKKEEELMHVSSSALASRSDQQAISASHKRLLDEKDVQLRQLAQQKDAERAALSGEYEKLQQVCALKTEQLEMVTASTDKLLSMCKFQAATILELKRNAPPATSVDEPTTGAPPTIPEAAS
jgi:hypothetical protein